MVMSSMLSQGVKLVLFRSTHLLKHLHRKLHNNFYRNELPSISICLHAGLFGNTNMKQTKTFDANHQTVKQFDLPAGYGSYLQIYDKIPLLDINLPSVDFASIVTPDSMIKQLEVIGPGSDSLGKMCKGGMLRIRRKKMNKHKYKKRLKRDRAKIRKVLIHRERARKRKRQKIKIKFQKKVNDRLESNPQSTYGQRAYVVHRLTKW